MIKVYIAAPWSAKAEALEAKKKFEAGGFEVTSRWIERDTPKDIGDRYLKGVLLPEDIPFLQEEAYNDLDDVLESEVFVLLNLGKSEGKATEFGVAYVAQMPIIIVGSRVGNIFYQLPEIVETETVEEAMALLTFEGDDEQI